MSNRGSISPQQILQSHKLKATCISLLEHFSPLLHLILNDLLWNKILVLFYFDVLFYDLCSLGVRDRLSNKSKKAIKKKEIPVIFGHFLRKKAQRITIWKNFCCNPSNLVKVSE